MIIFGSFLVLFGLTEAIDLTGCHPRKPLVIDGVRPLSGEITSPGYKEGEEYPEDLLCQYTVKAPYGMRIKLTFEDLDLEVADLCGRDAIEIVEQSIGQPPVGLGVYCGNQTYPPIISRGHIVSIILRTDYMIGGRGFRIKYQVSAIHRPCELGKVTCKNRNCFSPSDACNGKDDCGDGTDEENCNYSLPTTTCGVKSAPDHYGYDRVIGGKESQPGSWPWQADLQMSFIHPNGHTCGGTLINAQWVLTAAHCFQQFRTPEMWRIHLGNHHKFKKDASEQVRYAERIIAYPDFTGQKMFQVPEFDITHDMALIKLNAPVKFTDEVRPACIPEQGYELPLGKKCMASGWGITRGTGSNDVLKEVDLTVQRDEACTGLMGPINNTTMICVKNERGFQDVCHGDSGGPLVCELDGKWNIMGATSYGSDGNFEGGLCALPSSGTVYAKVSNKTKWIQEQINKYS